MDIEDVIMFGLAGVVAFIVWQHLQASSTSTPVSSLGSSTVLGSTPAASGVPCPIPGTTTMGQITASGACFGIYGPATAPAGTVCPAGQSWQQGVYSGPVTIKGQSFPGGNIPPGCQPIEVAN